MKRVLVICDDPWHPAGTIRRGLDALGECGLHFDYLQDEAAALREKLLKCSVVVFARTNTISSTDLRPWLTPDLASELREYLQRGNGLVAIHGGTSRYEQISGMTEVIGGALRHHPEPCAVTIEPVAGYPVAKGVTPFVVHDEHYWMTMSASPLEVFLHSRSRHGVQPAGWTRAEGAGRVCVLTPGHYPEVWLHSQFQKLLLNALSWTARLN